MIILNKFFTFHNIIILLAASKNNDLHVELLSKISKYLMDDNFINELKNAENAEYILSIIYEKEKNDSEKIISNDHFKILAKPLVKCF